MTIELADPSAKSDLDQLRRTLESSSVEAGLGAEAVSLRPGRLTARMPLSERNQTPDGRLSPFALAMLADLGVGVAVQSAVVGTQGGPTVELTLALADEPHPAARCLIVDSEVLTLSALAGIAKAEIRDDRGVLVAHAMGVMSTGDGPAVRAQDRVPGTGFDIRTIVVDASRPDRVRLAVDPTMANHRKTVHGGVMLGAALTAQEAFSGTPRRHGLTVRVHFLRPTPATGGHVECHSQHLRRGRRFHSVRTTVLRPDGAVAVEATTTSVILS